MTPPERPLPYHRDEGFSASSVERSEPSRPERICPTCGAGLIERKCKLLCPDPACGYYMSCSDFY